MEKYISGGAGVVTEQSRLYFFIILYVCACVWLIKDVGVF